VRHVDAHAIDAGGQHGFKNFLVTRRGTNGCEYFCSSQNVFVGITLR